MWVGIEKKSRALLYKLVLDGSFGLDAYNIWLEV